MGAAVKLGPKPKTWFQGYTSFPGEKRRVYEGDGFRNHLVASFETEEDAADAVSLHNAALAAEAAHAASTPTTPEAGSALTYADLIRALIQLDGWNYCGPYADPAPAPEGFTLETREDGFLGIPVHYRFIPKAEEA